MNTKFTKGQWLSSAKINSTDDAVITSTVNDATLTIAKVYGHNHVCDDANLISAAPDLYDALCEVLDFYESDIDCTNHDRWELALKKARGEK